MRIEDFTNPNGELILIKDSDGADGYAFVPAPLPPEIEWDNELVRLIAKANGELSRLDAFINSLPNPEIIMVSFLKREAVLSSRIEGTQASLEDLLIYEVTQKETTPDVREVYNYVNAMEFALNRLNELPLCLRLLKETHKILLTGVRGQSKAPGRFRKVQNWIGPPGAKLSDATYVPPPPMYIDNLMSNLEKFIHDAGLPLLVQSAILHYQFEAIHPFLDGNGRLGRMLVNLFLLERKMLKHPVLNISAFFERHREEYYSYMLKVSITGDWNEWLKFFMKAVQSVAVTESQKAEALIELREKWRRELLGKISPAALRTLELFFISPVLTASMVAQHLNITHQGAAKALIELVNNEVAIESSTRKWRKSYIAPNLSKILEQK